MKSLALKTYLEKKTRTKKQFLKSAIKFLNNFFLENLKKNRIFIRFFLIVVIFSFGEILEDLKRNLRRDPNIHNTYGFDC